MRSPPLPREPLTGLALAFEPRPGGCALLEKKFLTAVGTGPFDPLMALSLKNSVIFALELPLGAGYFFRKSVIVVSFSLEFDLGGVMLRGVNPES